MYLAPPPCYLCHYPQGGVVRRGHVNPHSWAEEAVGLAGVDLEIRNS